MREDAASIATVIIRPELRGSRGTQLLPQKLDLKSLKKNKYLYLRASI